MRLNLTPAVIVLAVVGTVGAFFAYKKMTAPKRRRVARTSDTLRTYTPNEPTPAQLPAAPAPLISSYPAPLPLAPQPLVPLYPTPMHLTPPLTPSYPSPLPPPPPGKMWKKTPLTASELATARALNPNASGSGFSYSLINAPTSPMPTVKAPGTNWEWDGSFWASTITYPGMSWRNQYFIYSQTDPSNEVFKFGRTTTPGVWTPVPDPQQMAIK